MLVFDVCRDGECEGVDGVVVVTLDAHCVMLMEWTRG